MKYTKLKGDIYVNARDLVEELKRLKPNILEKCIFAEDAVVEIREMIENSLTLIEEEKKQ